MLETAYKKDTPDAVVNTLEEARKNNMRITIIYGDRTTGKPWGVIPSQGYVGRSAITKLPILLSSKNSGGGVCIMDASILEIRESRSSKIIYKLGQTVDV